MNQRTNPKPNSDANKSPLNPWNKLAKSGNDSKLYNKDKDETSRNSPLCNQYQQLQEHQEPTEACRLPVSPHNIHNFKSKQKKLKQH